MSLAHAQYAERDMHLMVMHNAQNVFLLIAKNAMWIFLNVMIMSAKLDIIKMEQLNYVIHVHLDA